MSDGEWYDRFNAAVREQQEEVMAHIEEVCEAAVQGGEHGVLIIGTHAEVSSIVPYGQVWDASKTVGGI